MNTQLWPHVPVLALALGTALVGAWFLLAIRRWELLRRPALVVAAALVVLPSLYVGLVWNRWLPETYVRFERPLFAPLVTLAGLFVVGRLLGLSARQSRARRLLSELTLTATVLAAGLATLGVELGRPLDRLAVVVSIDRSRSMDLVKGVEARLDAELQVAEVGMGDDDRIGTLVFAGDAAMEDPLRPRTRMPAPQKVELVRDATDIGAAIRRALLEVPPDAGARIVLLSDGVANRGDAIEAASAAVAAGVPIDVIPLDQARINDVRLVAVRMSSRANQGEALRMRVVTEATQESPAELRVYRDGVLIRKGEVTLRKGEDVLTLKEKAAGPGLHRYEVQVTAKNGSHDLAAEDNSASTFVRVKGESSALVLAGKPAVQGALRDALTAAAFRVDVVGPTEVPGSIAEFAAHDLVVLSDIAAGQLDPAQIAALASYVRDLGGGLLLLGGDRSMGPGGYGKTPIEEVSPVSFDLKQERRRASLAEVIAIDYSGSMAMMAGGKTKLELANEAAARSAELLGTGDRLGVMHVDTTIQWTVPLGPVTNKKKIAGAITAVGPGGGGIYVDLTLRAAYKALDAEKVNLKHVLLFSDGSDAERKAAAPTLVASAQSRGITTSVVALGKGHDVLDLERLSRLGKGRFYLVEDASRLPAVFAQETILAARSALYEKPFAVAPGVKGPILRGVDLTAAPQLKGYVVTIPKARSQVHLRGPEGDPILATWSVGIGRAAAFTSDYKDRWGLDWTGWDGAARLFGQLGRDIARRGDDPRVRLDTETSGGELRVRATVVDDDGHTESFRRLKVRVAGPSGFMKEVALEAVGAGAYAARVPLARPGAYITTAVDEQDDRPLATTGATLTAGQELQPTGTNRALLERIASITGGKVRATMAGIFEDREARRFAYESLTGWLLAAAAWLLLGSVVVRRVSLPTAMTAGPRQWLARMVRPPRDEAPNEKSGSVARKLAQRRDEQRPPPGAEADAAPPSTARFDRPAPSAASAEAAPAPARGRKRRGKPRPKQAPRPKKSAAEILLERRRGQK